VTVFTCGPSIYQRAHIGNFRTFLFEDVLVRYLDYLGYTVVRGMNFTDVEDKAIKEAARQKLSVAALTGENIKGFIQEMASLRMKTPDFLPKASEHVESAAELIQRLLDRGIAYWHKGNVYFDPLQFSGFGALSGLDMSTWPAKKRRFHKDTYPGMRWNRGDFVLWHGCPEGAEVCWDTKIGTGRPSWNIQDPSMVARHFNETLSLYCGGIDNLVRHHDYSRAILESVRPFPMARFWLHCHHLHVNGQKMSKSKGNVYHIDTILARGYGIDELRFFLICSHYRNILNYSDKAIGMTSAKLSKLKEKMRALQAVADKDTEIDGASLKKLKGIFAEKMDNDLDVQGAFDGVLGFLSEVDVRHLTPGAASGIVQAVKDMDEVLQVIF
jgi:cysteinyl-tRNA synthetase